jgi:phosphonate degradation associated HDIG domain protein
MSLNLADIRYLLEVSGKREYGHEAVSQLEHALQCASLAQQAKETPETIVAALLHDLGHLIEAEHASDIVETEARDDLHQYIALPFLKGLFPESVLAPIRMHVDAKRYLCGVENGYWEKLSVASKHSLELQGGPFSQTQAKAFLRKDFAAEAIRLRRYDDLAKQPNKAMPPLTPFLDLICVVRDAHCRQPAVAPRPQSGVSLLTA